MNASLPDAKPTPETAMDVERAWTRFEATARSDASTRILQRFGDEPDRLERLTFEAAGLTLDLSKQPWAAETEAAALALCRAAGLEARRAALFAGEAVNASEGRAVLHPALRAADGAAFSALGQPVSAEVEANRSKMRAFAEDVRSGAVAGKGARRFRTLVHIGIGGSDLGPRLVWEALRPLDAPLELRFVANVDGAEIAAALQGLDPRETLVVVVSKTFTTQETLSNAEAARAWLQAALGEDVSAHLAAVSAAPAAAAAFGVRAERVFGFRDWVGGRFSLWSAVGLSCAVGLGWSTFERMLSGAAAMDAHFAQAPLERSAPVWLALTQLLNRNGLERGARAVVPYARRLRLLPAFLQQLEMESNGKRVTAEGRRVPRATAPVVFGDAGTNGQHAFFQLLHQGTDVIPVEFIASANGGEGPAEAQAKLLANVLAQGEALLAGAPGDKPERDFPGDRPSTLIVMDTLGPERLGTLLALYEHKVFVEGVLLGINSFDQWGVELGKRLAGRILSEWDGGEAGGHDPSTARWVERFKPARG